MHEVCSTRLINDGPVQLGGPGVIVQIDEFLFRHKQNVHVPVYYTDTGTACITNFCNIDSIIVEDVPNMSCGCLGWWIRHIILPGGICKWWTQGMPILSSHASGHIHCQGQSFILTSGLLTAK